MDHKQIFNIYNGNKNVYPELKLDLLGSYQAKNCITALKSIDLLTENFRLISSDAIYKGMAHVIANTGLNGRWQILNSKPLTVCDTGHNKEGLAFVMEQITQTAHKKLHFVFGVVDDKNLDQILGLLPKDAIYYFTNADIPRALDRNLLKGKAKKHQLEGDTYETVQTALENAKKNAGDNDLIFIGGSTFVVAEVV